MESTAATIAVNGSPLSAVESIAGTAGTVSEPQENKPCPYPYCGCISQNGYLCLNKAGVCEPVDDRGRKFRMVSFTTADRQTVWTREWLTEGEPAEARV